MHVPTHLVAGMYNEFIAVVEHTGVLYVSFFTSFFFPLANDVLNNVAPMAALQQKPDHDEGRRLRDSLLGKGGIARSFL